MDGGDMIAVEVYKEKNEHWKEKNRKREAQLKKREKGE